TNADASDGPRATMRITLHGDSTANSLGWALRGLQDPELRIMLHGEDGFNLLRSDLPAWPDNDAEARVLLLGGAFLYGLEVRGEWAGACHPEWQSRFADHLDRWLASASNGAERLWVATAPHALGRYDTPHHRGLVDCVNRSIRA